MDRAKHETELPAALTAFETTVSTPIISGELADWMERVRTSWEEASTQIQHNLEYSHPQQYDEMGEEDAELLPKIESLKAEDEAIEQERARIAEMIERDARHVPKLEPDEAKAQKHVQSLIDESLAFVTRVRKQEVAVQTWLVEAFQRDRGAGD